MNVIYPLTVQHDYTELRYSLRSLEKFFPGKYEVIIIGATMPGWINNVTQLVVPDVPGRKQLSIKAKIIAGLQYTGERVLFMNDDVYLLELTDAKRHPYYYWGTLEKYHAESGSELLLRELTKMGKPTKNFDGHFPLVYDTDFIEVARQFSADTIIKSMYCNYLNIEGEFLPDNKVLAATPPDKVAAFISGRSSFSTSYYSLHSCLPVLKRLFPEPGKYEI